MSYQRSYRTTISGTVSGSRSVPASQSSQTVNMTLNWSEDIETVIIVDTDPVDRGVRTISSELNVLEAGIVSGAQVQIHAKAEGAGRIVDSTVRGFRTLIFSEIDQQLKELHARVESRSALLVAEKQAALAKGDQFHADFQRIKGRYVSLFEKLDLELERRIKAVDAPVFQLVEQEFKEKVASPLSGSPVQALLSTIESEPVRQALSQGRFHRSGMALVRSLCDFLLGQQELLKRFQKSLLGKAADAVSTLSLPVVLMTTQEQEQPVTAGVHPFSEAQIRTPFESAEVLASKIGWMPMPPDQADQLGQALGRLTDRHAVATSVTVREAEYIGRWWKESQPLTVEK